MLTNRPERAATNPSHDTPQATGNSKIETQGENSMVLPNNYPTTAPLPLQYSALEATKQRSEKREAKTPYSNERYTYEPKHLAIQPFFPSTPIEGRRGRAECRGEWINGSGGERG
jgi:hypothetical protein